MKQALEGIAEEQLSAEDQWSGKIEKNTHTLASKIKACLKLLRMHQWVKNFFIFLPFFFDMHVTNLVLLKNAFIAFVAFSLVASSVYIFNDLFDVAADRLHPLKKNRPLAKGTINKTEAIYMMVVLAGIGLSVFGYLGWYPFFLVLFYLIQNIAYCVKLKNYALVDVTIISIGFVLRIFIGGAVTHTYLSNWIILMTFLLALFLALAKRRDDVIIFNSTGKMTRKNIQGYNLEFLNAAYTIMASVVIVAYIMYTVERKAAEHVSNKLFLSSFFVILGILRYLQITMVFNKSGSPTNVLIRDRFLQVVIVGWVGMMFALLYLKF